MPVKSQDRKISRTKELGFALIVGSISANILAKNGVHSATGNLAFHFSIVDAKIRDP